VATIPSTYEESRERFRASLPSFQELWPKAGITSIPLTGQPDLTIEVISAEARENKQKRLILTTGLHGIEGYVGSGILQLFTEEFLSRIDPVTTGIVLVHPINPFGMKYRTRVNKNSVDLNRNFTNDFESLKAVNPHYEGLGYFLNPGKPLKSLLYEKSAFINHVLRALVKGASFIREAALMGQYRVHDGIYFGGFDQQEETQITMDLFRNSIVDYAQVVVLDIHTGYGPRWQMTLVNPPSEKRTSSEIASQYNLPRVVGTNPDEFYTMHGDMTDHLLNLLQADSPGRHYYVGAFEFGTYGDSFLEAAHSLRTTIYENCLRWFGGESAAREWVEHEYKELYLPAEPKWWEKAQVDARKYLEGILQVEGFLK
jgi:hypothetical protein